MSDLAQTALKRAVYVFNPRKPVPAPGALLLTKTTLLPGGAALSLTDVDGNITTALLSHVDLLELYSAAETIMHAREDEDAEDT